MPDATPTSSPRPNYAAFQRLCVAAARTELESNWCADVILNSSVNTTASSRARVLFEKFTGNDGLKILNSLPSSTPKVVEDEILEFKSGQVKSDDLDDIWSKVLGAFANNEGGVVVWGIQAQRDEETGIDAAHSVSLVPNVDALKQKLLEKYQFLTDPVLAGTDVISLPTANTESTGFVVCFIPEGTHKPYRSLKAKQPYYIRIKDDSVEIPHTLLRQLFVPKYEPRLAVHIANAQAPRMLYLNGNRIEMQNAKLRRDFNITIENIGDITVEDIYVLFEGSCAFTIWITRTSGPLEADLRPINKTFAFCDVLHPQMKSSVVNVIAASNAQISEISLTIKVFTKNALPQIFKFTITKNGLIPFGGNL